MQNEWKTNTEMCRFLFYRARVCVYACLIAMDENLFWQAKLHNISQLDIMATVRINNQLWILHYFNDHIILLCNSTRCSAGNNLPPLRCHAIRSWFGAFDHCKNNGQVRYFCHANPFVLENLHKIYLSNPKDAVSVDEIYCVWTHTNRFVCVVFIFISFRM